MTASEVATLQLNADWAVLSACNTASGETLARMRFQAWPAPSFLRAPAPCWYRTGPSTPRPLSISRHGHSRSWPQSRDKDGRRHSSAAMLTLIAEGHPPTYWAPFIIVGEGGPVSERAADHKSWLIAAPPDHGAGMSAPVPRPPFLRPYVANAGEKSQDISCYYPLIFGGMAEPHVISALKTKREELQRAVRSYEGRLKKAKHDLASITAALRVFGDEAEEPLFNRPSLFPKRNFRD